MIYHFLCTMKNIILIIVAVLMLLFILVLSVYYFCNAYRLLFSKTKKAPYVPTFDRHLVVMKKLKIKKNATMVDLGCGDGKALRFFSKEHHLKSADWFDINPYTILKWRCLNKYHKITNVHLYKKNLFDVDIEKYDYIYLYLWESQLAIMEDWIRETKKADAIIISNSFKFAKHKPFDVYKSEKWVDTVFLYK